MDNGQTIMPVDELIVHQTPKSSVAPPGGAATSSLA